MEDVDVDGRVLLKWIFKIKVGMGGARTALVLLKTGTICRLL